MSSIEVVIYGRKYKLKGEDPQKLRTIAEMLNQQLLELGDQHELMEFSKLLLLCSLQLQEKVYELTKSYQELSDELERIYQLLNTFSSGTEQK